MKKGIWLALMIPLIAAVAVRAQSGFNGTWKADMKTIPLPKKPRVYLLQNGVWHCKSCDPVLNIKADGKDYPISLSDPCVQTTSVRIIDPRTMQVTDKQDGRVTYTMTGRVSPDGKMLHFRIKDTCQIGGQPVLSDLQEHRIAAGPAGSYPISGSWRITSIHESGNGLLLNMKIEGDTLTYSGDATGSFTAKLGGPSVPVKSDPKHETASARMIDKNTLETTFRANGKLADTDRLTLAPDGKTMKVQSNTDSGKFTIVFVKQ